ncbi:MAG: cysteine desulfurase family protein [Phycisphaerae bacterium]
MADIIYLDNNATTRVDPRVIDKMVAVMRDDYGNPSSVHCLGTKASALVETGRAQVASLIGAQRHEILFTSGGTESDNAAICGVLRADPSKRHIITTAVEHHAVHEQCVHLESEGIEVTYLDVDCDGAPDLATLRAVIRPDTALVCVMLANNETGVILPVREIAEIAHAAGVPVMSDAVNALGKIPVNVEALGVDLLSLSAHKVYGPKGIGALFVRRGIALRPYIMGGPQERKRRGGTHNVPGIVGFGEACAIAAEYGEEARRRIAAMRDRLEAGVASICPDARVIGRNSPRVPNTSCICFAGCDAEVILMLLNERGICASSGSACSSGAIEASGVMRAMKVPPEVAVGQIRFSFGRYNTEAEVDLLLAAIPEVAKRCALFAS